MIELHKIIAKRVIRNVIKLREQKGWSMGQLARLTGISTPYQSLMEAGHRDPSLEMVCRFAVAFGVDPTRLFKES